MKRCLSVRSKHTPVGDDRDAVIHAYLRTVRSGIRPSRAAGIAGVGRDTIWRWRSTVPGFAREEQLARDAADVERAIAELAEEAE